MVAGEASYCDGNDGDNERNWFDPTYTDSWFWSDDEGQVHWIVSPNTVENDFPIHLWLLSGGDRACVHVNTSAGCQGEATMRYILAIVALVIAGMAVIAIVNSPGPQDARQQAGPLGSSIELTRTQPASTISPEWAPPTPDPTQVAKATTQEALIAWAKRTAQFMGEPSPSLVDVRETTFAEALKLLGLHSQPTDPPDDHPVYVLRMKGKFKPYHSIGAVDVSPVPGIMHLIIDAKTRYTLRIGYIESSDDNP